MRINVKQIQAASGRMAAAGDREAVRRMYLYILTAVCHVVARWTLLPALVLAVITGEAFFVKILLFAVAGWYCGGVSMLLQFPRLQRLLAPYGLHLTVKDARSGEPPRPS